MTLNIERNSCFEEKKNIEEHKLFLSRISMEFSYSYVMF